MDPEDKVMRCEGFRDQVEPYIDGDLDAGAQSAMDAHLSHCETCRGEVEMARRIKTALNAMPSLSCPDRVVESARFLTQKTEAARRPFGLPSWAHYGLAAATVLVAALGFAFWPTSDDAPPTNVATVPDENDPPTVDAQRIAQAEAQIKWTLAYIGQINQQSAEAASAHLVPAELYGPTSRTLSALFGTKSADPAKEI